MFFKVVFFKPFYLTGFRYRVKMILTSLLHNWAQKIKLERIRRKNIEGHIKPCEDNWPETKKEV